FSGNFAGVGGAFRVTASNLLVENCTLTGNRASTGGAWDFGGNSNQTCTIRNCTIVNNTGTSQAGGIRSSLAANNVAIESSVVAGNVNATAPDLAIPGTV